MKLSRVLVALVAMLSCFAVLVPSAQSQRDRPENALSIYQVFVDDQADIDALVNSGLDLVEGRGADYLLVVGEADVATALRQDGFRVREERQLDPLAPVARDPRGGAFSAAAATTYYGGYRTVDEHYAHLGQVEAAYPGLAKVVDYGDSWRLTNGVEGGNELLTICLTNRQFGDCALSPNSAKPRAVVMAAIHARELQTSEVAWRLIDELTQQYGVDADITNIMDTTEVWVIPVVNPDGREIVESGGNSPYLQRKNANDSLGNCSVPPTSSNQHGVDLNRNASYLWGGTGTSTNPCAQTYRGTSAASEPEQDSLQALFSQLWPDQRSSPTATVPASATGTFITMHSYGNLILFPPGTSGVTPNDTELRTLAFRMSHFNGYQAGTGPEILYGTTGTTDDWAYGELGVASFTYELSPTSGACSGFTPAYSCVDGSIWPTNRDALLYSLKVAGAPYVTPLGPTTISVTTPPVVSSDSTFELSVDVDDDALGNAEGSVGRPSPSAVTAVEYYVDAGPAAGGSPIAMTAADGSFNSGAELAKATVSTSGLTVGEHTIYARGRNANGYWGPITAAAFTVLDGPIPTSETATADSPVAGSVSGTFSATWSADGVTQSITEVESGGRKSSRYDLAEHRWSIPNAGGEQTLAIVASATDGGDGDTGFSIEWTTNGTSWIPVATVSAGSPVNDSFAIGAPTGTISVRVIDTNRSAGQRSFDSVSVDLLRVDGDGSTSGPTDPTLALASLDTSTVGAGRGQQYGVATVQVSDDQGDAVAGASVTVRFSGDFGETLSGSTDASGAVTIRTTASVRKPVFSACVVSVDANGLTYTPGSEAC